MFPVVTATTTATTSPLHLSSHKTQLRPFSPLRFVKQRQTSTITLSLKNGKKNHPSSNSTNSWVSPDWLTNLSQSTKPRDESGIPLANAKLEDVSDLLGGALFLPLFKWMNEYGSVYRLAAGPRNFVVVSDPTVAKHILKNYGKYAKGLVSEVSEFLFGSGFAIAEGSLWTVIKGIFSSCSELAVNFM